MIDRPDNKIGGRTPNLRPDDNDDFVSRDTVDQTAAKSESKLTGTGASPLQSEGTWTYTFEEAGSYDYHCEPHPFMTGTIIVVETGVEGAT